MKIHQHSRSSHSLTLAQGHSDLKIKTFSQKPEPFVTKFHKKAFRNKKEINKYEFGHMKNMAAMPVYSKII